MYKVEVNDVLRILCNSDILEDEQKKEQFGNNGILKMKDYSVPVLGKKYLKLYSELLQK